MSDRFDELRALIAANDRAIVGLVNERLRHVAELWEIKRGRSLDQLDPERERALREALGESNAGPLSSRGLDELVDALLALTKRELRGTTGD